MKNVEVHFVNNVQAHFMSNVGDVELGGIPSPLPSVRAARAILEREILRMPSVSLKISYLQRIHLWQQNIALRIIA
jgi:hypothetical protein